MNISSTNTAYTRRIQAEEYDAAITAAGLINGRFCSLNRRQLVLFVLFKLHGSHPAASSFGSFLLREIGDIDRQTSAIDAEYNVAERRVAEYENRLIWTYDPDTFEGDVANARQDKEEWGTLRPWREVIYRTSEFSDLGRALGEWVPPGVQPVEEPGGEDWRPVDQEDSMSAIDDETLFLDFEEGVPEEVG